MARKTTKKPVKVDTLKHEKDKRRNIPTAELDAVMTDMDKAPIQVAYERRNEDLDPQLVWRGKDVTDWSDLMVQAPPIYIQEKVHPKVLIDDLLRQTKERADEEAPDIPDLFGDFNGLPDQEAKTEFYAHDQNWSNRMILGDSLQSMASLAEREGLRGKVQCIYFDPPYGIKFNSNFQWSTTSRDVKDGKADHITREPEQVKAFRDTWRDGIHSYLTYLRDRLTVARDLLTESGSIFVQIGDENVHRVRALMDEVFGEDNFLSMITLLKSTGVIAKRDSLHGSVDYILQYSKERRFVKFRPLFKNKSESNEASFNKFRLQDGTIARGEETSSVRAKYDNLKKQGPGSRYDIEHEGVIYTAGKQWWGFSKESMPRLQRANRVAGNGSNLYRIVLETDYAISRVSTLWDDVANTPELVYVVQTNERVVQRCLLMATDPGDLVLDPTCGSGTTAYVAEQWGRRWITMDTSRVSLALARARIMGARYPWYLLADSPEGLQKEGEITRTPPKDHPTYGNIRQGFVYERVPHITLKSIANNAEIDVIWETFQQDLEPLREALNSELKQSWEEWEIPREADDGWSDQAKKLHAQWWEQRIARQKEIDASIAAKADYEYLYDKPYQDNGRVRVAGPFTVESLSPHRTLVVDEEDELVDALEAAEGKRKRKSDEGETDFAQVILDNLKAAGVQQAHKEDKIDFTSIAAWPGEYVCAEGRYMEGDTERRAGIFIGPEFGTVSRPDLVAAAREAGDAGFDVLITCAFNYDAHSTEFEKLGRLPVLKARMNADLHMADDLKTTGKGNLFVIFGEPDIEIEDASNDNIQVRIRGVDVFHPQTGEIQSSEPDDIACWFIDTDYNEESFFVRHAYFLGASDPYKSLKTTLKAQIDAEAWETLNSDTSRPFPRPDSGRIAVKVINHLGDEVMKVFGV